MARFSIEAVFKATDQMTRVIGQIETRMGRFASGFGSSLKSIDRINSKIAGGLQDIATKAAAFGVVAGGVLGVGLSKVVATGAEFEQKITDVGAVMGKSRSQIGDLEKEAMRLGVATQFSSTQVAGAMEFMARKGFDSKEILQGIPGVLNAVAASGQGMAEVATVVGSSIRGFGLEAAEASRVANILAYTAEKTGATITDMGTALAIAAPTAKTLGVSIDDTAAAVGLLQKMGIDASTAGTATSTMLAKITKPSAEAAQQMAALGIKFKDAKGDMLPFNDVLKQFVKAGDKAGGNMNRMAFFAELVGLRGDKAAIALSDMSKSGDFERLVDGIKNTGDYAERVAKLRMDTTTGSWKLFLSTVEVLETKLFNLKSGSLRGVVDKMNAWVTANQDLIVTKVDDFVKKLGDNLPTIVIWVERFAKVAGVFMAFAFGVRIATGAMALFNFVSNANPWVMLLYGVVLLMAAFVAFWPEIKKHEKAFRQVGVAIVEVMGGLLLLAGAYGIFLLVTNASTLATIAYVGWVLAARGAVAAWTFVTNGQAIKTGILTGLQWAQTFAVGVYTGVLGIGQKAIGLFTGETVAMTGAMSAAVGPLLAVAAAIGAIYLAKKMNDDLKKNTGGMGIFDIAGGMIKEGTLDPFKVVDKHQNELARQAAGMPPVDEQVAGLNIPGLPPGSDPQAMIAALMAQQQNAMHLPGVTPGMPGVTPPNAQDKGPSPKEVGEAMAAAMAPILADVLKQSKGEIVVRAQNGTKAEVSQQTKAGSKLVVEQSGAM